MSYKYDYIIAGGGLAGMTLALHLQHSSLPNASILIVDRDAKEHNDRTWCFWADKPTLFDSIVSSEWDRLHFVGENFETDLVLQTYRYKMIRGLDLYHFVRDRLSAQPLVEFARGCIERIEEGADTASVKLNGERVSARYLFDSRFDNTSIATDPTQYHNLHQYFRGWLIETSQAMFDSRCATLMDFRVAQANELRFFYVLPLSQTRALVEFVTSSPARYDRAIKHYIETVLNISDYRVLETEGGVNPLTDYPFPRRASKHVLNIGTRGGRVKPSTGYAFTRIQQDSAAIVRSLNRFGDPFHVPADPAYYRLCDALWLDIMQRQGEQIKPLFTALFKNNPIERVLHFLDQAASPAENLSLMASLPTPLFLQALFRVAVRSKLAPTGGLL